MSAPGPLAEAMGDPNAKLGKTVLALKQLAVDLRRDDGSVWRCVERFTNLTGLRLLFHTLAHVDALFWEQAERLRFAGYRVERFEPPEQTDIEPAPLFRVRVSVSRDSPAHGYGDGKGGGFEGAGNSTAAALLCAIVEVEAGAKTAALAKALGKAA